MLPMSLFRVRVRLRMTGSARLRGCHFAALYGLLACAHGMATRQETSLPDGLWLEAPEQGRTELAAGNEYAFGFTLLAKTGRDASRRIQSLLRGLSLCGTNGLDGAVFGRNFRVAAVEDLVAQATLTDDAEPQPISETHFLNEVAIANGLPTVTLRMTSPLRMQRPKNLRDGGHAFFDRRWFRPPLFLQRVGLRLQRLGWTGALPEFASDASEPHLIDNQLVWLDLSYGDGQRRKLLGGGVGDVIFSGVPRECVPALVWGQYVGVGESTRFGFGRYRIAELGPEPFACHRATELLDVALSSARLDRAAERYQLEPGAVTEAAEQVRRRTYAPQPPYPFELRDADRTRTLNIPQAVDRALQSAVCDWLAPVLEGFFEESSLAFRKGLGRHRAARRLEVAFQDGYRWAVKSDVHRFFDSVDHAELQRRLRVYLADAGLIELLMQWVRAGSPGPERGLPTGAPISPLLANLFLDHLDEAVERDGARLVRYADDFLVLVRERDEAERMLAAVRRTVAELQLSLNAEKTAVIELSGPFDFLGFRFERRERWETSDDGAPKCVDQLGWRESNSLRPTSGAAMVLPGEGPPTTVTDRTTVILGPGLEWLGLQDGRLAYRYEEGQPRRGDVPLRDIEQVLIIGDCPLHAPLVKALNGAALEVTFLDEYCRVQASLQPESPRLDPALVIAQAAWSQDESRRLALARELIAAKLHNHAVLADAARPPTSPKSAASDHSEDAISLALRALIPAVRQAQTLSELLGLEGAAARLWYGSLASRLPNQFASSFRGRVAPNAGDPVNALLNLAQTLLHRLITRLLQEAGFVTTLGLMHVPRSGHHSLASDLQEPFRHWMDAVVLDALQTMLPRDFEKSTQGRFALRIKPATLRRFVAEVHRRLHRTCQTDPKSEPVSYRTHLARTIRSLKRAMLQPDQTFHPFHHP